MLVSLLSLFVARACSQLHDSPKHLDASLRTGTISRSTNSVAYSRPLVVNVTETSHGSAFVPSSIAFASETIVVFRLHDTGSYLLEYEEVHPCYSRKGVNTEPRLHRPESGSDEIELQIGNVRMIYFLLVSAAPNATCRETLVFTCSPISRTGSPAAANSTVPTVSHGFAGTQSQSGGWVWSNSLRSTSDRLTRTWKWNPTTSRQCGARPTGTATAPITPLRTGARSDGARFTNTSSRHTAFRPTGTRPNMLPTGGSGSGVYVTRPLTSSSSRASTNRCHPASSGNGRWNNATCAVFPTKTATQTTFNGTSGTRITWDIVTLFFGMQILLWMV